LPQYLGDTWDNTWGILATILGGCLGQYLRDTSHNTWGILRTILEGYFRQHFTLQTNNRKPRKSRKDSHKHNEKKSHDWKLIKVISFDIVFCLFASAIWEKLRLELIEYFNEVVMVFSVKKMWELWGWEFYWRNWGSILGKRSFFGSDICNFLVDRLSRSSQKNYAKKLV
jgi:hypothetical protein